MADDFLHLLRMKPYDRRVAFEPCELFASISTCVSLYASDGFFQAVCSVEVGKHFPIADCVERIKMPEGINLSGFSFQPIGYHVENTVVDAFV